MPTLPRIKATIVIVASKETHEVVFDDVVQMVTAMMYNVKMANLTGHLTGIPWVDSNPRTKINGDDSLDMEFVFVARPTVAYMTVHAVKLS